MLQSTLNNCYYGKIATTVWVKLYRTIQESMYMPMLVLLHFVNTCILYWERKNGHQ